MQLRSILKGLLVAGSFFGRASAQTPGLYDETVLRTLDLTFAQSNWYTLLGQNYGTGVDLGADLTVEGVTYPNVGVHFRGGSSYRFIGTSQKKPFGISMDAFVPGQRLLGYKTLNLNNAYLDPTFVREVLSYNVFRRYLPAGKANFVVLRVNGVNWGVYVNVQQVNKDMMREWFVDEDGARMEADALLPGAVPNGSALTWLGSTPSSYFNNYDLKTTTLPQPWTPLIDTCSALNNTPLATMEAALQPRFALDAALRMIAANMVLVNPDSYVSTGHNYFVFHDAYHDRVQTIPWGMNLPLGSSILAGSTTAQRSAWNLFTNQSNSGRPLLSRSWALPALRQRYLAHVRTILTREFSWSLLQPRIAAYQNLIAAEVAADSKKLYPTAAFTANLSQDFVAGFTTISGLQPLVNGRAAYLQGHPELNRPAPTIANVAHQPTSPAPGATVWVSATIAGPAAAVGTATLYSRAIGPFQETPMFDDGQHMDGAANDGVYGAALPTYPPGSFVDYYVGAASTAAAGGAMTFAPPTAEFGAFEVRLPFLPGSGPVRINEFLADNSTVIQDPFGEWDDYLELVNVSPVAVDLSGMHLTDDLLNPTKFTLPAGTTIPADGTLLFWCDEDGAQGPMHANFKLAAGGEVVALFAADGITMLDSFTFGPQATDVSTGRLFDGGGPWVTFPVPTPYAHNENAGCGSRSYSGQSYASQSMALAVTGFAGVGSSFAFDVTAGPANAPGVLVVSLFADHAPLAGSPGALLVQTGPATVMPIALGPAGSAWLPLAVPGDPLLAGLTAYAQTAAIGGTAIELSSAVEVVLCP
ncbi:MAG: CotH kinase family protein [Planctomycetes bacterium]|nr:CotH kinase family protein [Planctomycetota bacterium]